MDIVCIQLVVPKVSISSFSLHIYFKYDHCILIVQVEYTFYYIFQSIVANIPGEEIQQYYHYRATQLFNLYLMSL